MHIQPLHGPHGNLYYCECFYKTNRVVSQLHKLLFIAVKNVLIVMYTSVVWLIITIFIFLIFNGIGNICLFVPVYLRFIKCSSQYFTIGPSIWWDP
jgi:hypothetical protein